jgi:hypothetical protein
MRAIWAAADSKLRHRVRSIRLKEKIMSKGQRGNKEAKKPKKVRSPAPPPSSTVVPAAPADVPDRLKRK